MRFTVFFLIFATHSLITLNISKAFERVNHLGKSFVKLMHRRARNVVIKYLEKEMLYFLICCHEYTDDSPFIVTTL